MIFDGWIPILRTLVAGLSAYIALIVILRISGKRTLSKWNAFDYVVTIALGSTLATILLSKDTSLAQGVAALFLPRRFAVRGQLVIGSLPRCLRTGQGAAGAAFS